MKSREEIVARSTALLEETGRPVALHRIRRVAESHPSYDGTLVEVLRAAGIVVGMKSNDPHPYVGLYRKTTLPLAMRRYGVLAGEIVLFCLEVPTRLPDLQEFAGAGGRPQIEELIRKRVISTEGGGPVQVLDSDDLHAAEPDYGLDTEEDETRYEQSVQEGTAAPVTGAAEDEDTGTEEGADTLKAIDDYDLPEFFEAWYETYGNRLVQANALVALADSLGVLNTAGTTSKGMGRFLRGREEWGGGYDIQIVEIPSRKNRRYRIIAPAWWKSIRAFLAAWFESRGPQWSYAGDLVPLLKDAGLRASLGCDGQSHRGQSIAAAGFIDAVVGGKIDVHEGYSIKINPTDGNHRVYRIEKLAEPTKAKAAEPTKAKAAKKKKAPLGPPMPRITPTKALQRAGVPVVAAAPTEAYLLLETYVDLANNEPFEDVLARVEDGDVEAYCLSSGQWMVTVAPDFELVPKDRLSPYRDSLSAIAVHLRHLNAPAGLVDLIEKATADLPTIGVAANGAVARIETASAMAEDVNFRGAARRLHEIAEQLQPKAQARTSHGRGNVDHY